MPVPKRKLSKSRRDKRSACKFIRPQSIHGCKTCGAATLPHVACEECGHYKGRQIMVGRQALRTEKFKARELAAQKVAEEQASAAK